jgi:hypothetical protein
MNKLTSKLLSTTAAIIIIAGGASAKDKIRYGDLTINGKLQVGVATDRNAGNAPVTEKSGSSDEEDDDDEIEESNDDLFEDLELEGQDLNDQLDETTDEDGDGDFFDDDDEIEAVDLDGDGTFDIDIDGDGDIDATDDSIAAVSGIGRGTQNNSIRDERFNATARVGFNYKIGSWAKEWKTNLQTGVTYFDTLDKQDNILFGGSTGPVFEVKSLKLKIQPMFTFATFVKDGASQFNNYGGALALQYDFNKQWQLSARYGNDYRHFGNNDIDDVYANSGALMLKHKFDKQKSLTGGYKIRYEDTDVAARGKIVHQFLIGYEQKFDYGLYFKPQVGYAYIERNGAAKAGQLVRQDDRTVANIAIGKDFENGINIELQYSNMDVESNITSKDTSNDRFVLLSGWKF